MVEKHFQCPFAFHAGGHDQVCPAFTRLEELQMHGADGFQTLFDDAVYRVELKAPQDAGVRVRVDEDLHVQLVSKFRQREKQQPLQHHDSPRQNRLAPTHAIIGREILDGLADRLAALQRRQMRSHQPEVNGVRVVPVDGVLAKASAYHL